MCGIIGIVGNEAVAERLVDGLRRMEYRGYDSAGICTLHEGELVRRRAEGKLANLVFELERHPAPGTVGIAHTRWATHGAPTASRSSAARDLPCSSARRSSHLMSSSGRSARIRAI